MPITLRNATDDDDSFLRDVYASTRKQEMAMVPWNEEQREAFLRMQFDAQHFHYHSRFPEASYQIVLSDEDPVGRLYVLRQEDEIRIMDITLLPQYRNAGIGKKLLKEIQNEADATARAVSIWVESFNPSTRLFESLGFSRVQEDGLNCLFEYRKSEN